MFGTCAGVSRPRRCDSCSANRCFLFCDSTRSTLRANSASCCGVAGRCSRASASGACGTCRGTGGVPRGAPAAVSCVLFALLLLLVLLWLGSVSGWLHSDIGSAEISKILKKAENMQISERESKQKKKVHSQKKKEKRREKKMVQWRKWLQAWDEHNIQFS